MTGTTDISRAAGQGMSFPGYSDNDGDYILNPNASFAVVKMSKDGGFVITLGDQKIGNPEELFFAVATIYGSRALFQRVDEKPVCSTAFLPPTKEGRTQWRGNWKNDEIPMGFNSGDDGLHPLCVRCKWSKFDSEKDWQFGKEDPGKGPACKEKRFLYGFIMKQSGEHNGVPLFERVNDTIHRIICPASSIKTVEGMVVKARGANCPLPAAVFKLSTVIMTAGRNTWAVLKGDIKGFVGQVTWADMISARAMIADAIDAYSESDDEPYGDTQAQQQYDENGDPIKF